MNRKELNDILNHNKTLYNEQIVKMKKAGASPEELERLAQILRAKQDQLISQHGDSLQKLNIGEGINVGNATISPELDQSSLPDMSKQKLLGKENMYKNISKSVGKKAIAALPFVGAGMAAMSGNPAMAAEELAQDAMGPAGLAYEAIKPESAGSVEDDLMMKAEGDAFNNYKNSPAGKAAKYSKIRTSLGIK